VQGQDALEELMGGVAAFEEDATVDVIVVTRGGGADKTLRIFNEHPSVGYSLELRHQRQWDRS